MVSSLEVKESRSCSVSETIYTNLSAETLNKGFIFAVDSAEEKEMYNLSNTHATIHSVHSLNQIRSLKTKHQLYLIFSYTVFLHDIQITPYFSLSVDEVTHTQGNERCVITGTTKW